MHVANALKQSASADGDVITWAWYNSLLANDVSVKPSAVIGVYPLFPDKAASAEVLTSGRAQYMLNEHHIKRTRYSHQVSLVSLYMLKQNAYVGYCNNRAGVANDSLCAVPARRRLPSICTIMRRTLQVVPRTGPYELRALAPCACP